MLDWIAEFFGSKDFTIFISHSFKDADWLDDYLAGVVTNLGAKYQMAEHDFVLSTEGPISDKVAEMIDSSDAVLALLNASGQASKFVQQEIGYAYKAKKPIIALIEEVDGRIEKPGFLFDKDVLTFREQAELQNLKTDLVRIIKKAWDKKKGTIRSNIVLTGLATGALAIGSLFPDEEKKKERTP